MNAEMIRSLYSFPTLLLIILVKVTFADVFLPTKLHSGIFSANYDLPTANISTLWINSGSNHDKIPVVTNETSSIGAVLTRTTRINSNNNRPAYVCGFYCTGNCDSYIFAVAIVVTDDSCRRLSGTCPQVVWSANRNSPVKINSTLELTSGGDLVLKDADGTIVWSTYTSGKSVSGMNLTEEGNLVLFDNTNTIIWQSFDFPTDSLLPGQRLRLGQKLTPGVSSTNWTEASLLSFTMTPEGLVGLMETDPPQIYAKFKFNKSINNRDPTNYIEYRNGSLSLFLNSKLDSTMIAFPGSQSLQFMRLTSEGYLRVYEWSSKSMKWTRIGDLLAGELGQCGHPRVCGDYGICTDGQCSCPESSGGEIYFGPINDRKPDLGCCEITPLSCGDHDFIELTNVFYFASEFLTSHNEVNSESCKRACSRSCSCKAAIFQFVRNVSGGSCYILSQVFSLMNNDQDRTHRNSTVYLKVQKTNDGYLLGQGQKTKSVRVIIASIVGALFGLSLLIGVGLLIWKVKYRDEPEEDRFDQVILRLPIRLSYQEITSATSNFTRKLGEGGFGSVFQGVLIDGTKIAVKQLDGLGTINCKNSFLAEVETIGSIHHFNLVRLVGFCAEKSHRLLAYEYMENGSLDRWIFRRKKDDFTLGWNQRKKIILDVAKGLNYLHEDCRQKIIHMDIKPQNILLDDNFNAKLSDFGLSKLINKHESQITVDSTTTVRGTLGYLAPECLKAVVSDKVDVYSFGVVILEIVCGRKVLDISLCDEHMHLVGLFKRKAKDEKLMDIVDKCIDDMELHGHEVMNILRVAAWCLRGDPTYRPSISMVVKVLDGSVEAERFEIDPELINLPWMEAEAVADTTAGYGGSSFQQPCVLSGPR